MVHISARDIELLVRNDLLYKARIKVDEIAGGATHVCQMLNSETETTRTGGTDHDPVMMPREMFVGNLGRKFAVIGFVIFPTDTLLRHASRAARFKNIERL